MSAAVAAIRERIALPSLPRRWRLWLLVLALLAAIVGAGYLLWFRDSSFVAVEDVTVTGATSKDAERLRAKLASVAQGMTTLHVDRAALDEAVAAYPAVRDLKVSTDFPHAMTIRVIEHEPAALADTGPGTVPVAGDGTVLRGLTVKGSLPEIESKGGLDGDRLADPVARRTAAVAGAAPLPLRRKLEDVRSTSDRGLVAQLAEGPELVFGDARRLRAKWIAAARVLADPEAAGATYIDVRLPGRPAAGGLAAVPQP
jgi:cell division protein FtsQ